MKAQHKQQGISIVIPAYNEAYNLGACLDSIARQTVQPTEVIVVDNNSSDSTEDIARSYPFVTVLSEKRRGIAYARNTGFAAASGDIIVRTDADSIPSDNWIAEIVHFMDSHPQVSGVSGKYSFYDVSYQDIAGGLQVLVYQYFQYLLTDTYFLCGANMAVRRKAYFEVADRLSSRADIDEDIDLTFCLADAGHRIEYHPSMLVETELFGERKSLRGTWQYLSTWPKDYVLHRRYIAAATVYIAAVMTTVLYFPVAVMGWVGGTKQLFWQRDKSRNLQ